METYPKLLLSLAHLYEHGHNLVIYFAYETFYKGASDSLIILVKIEFS